MADLNPFGGNFNLNIDEGDVKNGVNIFTLGLPIGPIANSLNFDITDPFGTKAAAQQQQNMINQYQAQQEALIRDEQNRQWQTEISNSWAAFGAQRRSQAAMGGFESAAKLGASTATDLYLGGR